MKKINVPSNVTVSGPFFAFSSPYGKATLQRDEWFVSKKLTKKEQKTEIQKILGTTSLGHIIKFKSRKDYVIDQLSYPGKYFSSLQKAINFLVDQDKNTP